MPQPEPMPRLRPTPFWKRAMDVCVAAPALVVLAPVMLLIGLLVRVFLGSPILFRQARPGHGGVPFELIKFRTMLDAVDRRGQPLPDAARLTRFGRFLRSTSLDELPELWNIVRGDMSLVGPRPLLLDYLPLYSAEQARRHEILPGLTGWAQVNGRNGLSWDEKFRLDVWYVENLSLWLDIRIILRTAIGTLTREGISGGPDGTTQRFTPSTGAALGERDPASVLPGEATGDS